MGPLLNHRAGCVSRIDPLALGQWCCLPIGSSANHFLLSKLLLKRTEAIYFDLCPEVIVIAKLALYGAKKSGLVFPADFLASLTISIFLH